MFLNKNAQPFEKSLPPPFSLLPMASGCVDRREQMGHWPLARPGVKWLVAAVS